MKKYSILALVLVIMLAVAGPASAQRKDKKKKGKAQTAALAIRPVCSNNLDTISYIIGSDIASNFLKNEIAVNSEVFYKGFCDGLAKKDSLFTPEQIAGIMQTWQQGLNDKRQAAAAVAIEKNRKAGEDFLTANKSKPGVVVTPSGLQYIVVKEGEGQSPADTDVVKVHYTGTLIDGTKFDSSRDRGEPAEFPVNGVIPGWTEALKLMKPGAVFKLFIPSELAYGDHKTGPIPEASTLLFEVELLSIEKK